jgi:cyclopropane-fatty-acyl-phospholipid synthase
MKTSTNKSKQVVSKVLGWAGIELDGSRPYDIKVRDERLYDRLLREKDLGFGESYMDGWWDAERLDILAEKIIGAEIHIRLKQNPRVLLSTICCLLFNLQTKQKAKKVAQEHYDLGNNLYELMLDKNLSYSCGYWKFAKDLDEAQEHKLEMICQKLQLKPGMKLLDIGCGWGAMARHAAKYHGARVVGVTISKEQQKLAQERCRGLPIEIRLQDYRDIRESFDRIVSIGMFEHVGYKNYRTFMKVCNRTLTDDGLFLLHTIGGNQSRVMGNPWIEKYIFPHGMIPSIKQIGESIEGLFVMEDWHNLSTNYDKTLMAWHKNFNQNWPIIKEFHSEKFKRMWNFYLLFCAGTFRARYIQLWQVVLSKNGVKGGYQIRDLNLSKQREFINNG